MSFFTGNKGWLNTGTGGSVVLNYSTITDTTLTTVAITANQVLDSFPVATSRAAKYIVSTTSGTSYQVDEILIMQDGTNAYITQYADIHSGAALSSFSATISGGNCQLTVTPVNAATTYKANRIAINV
jgi:hypothetical protein